MRKLFTLALLFFVLGLAPRAAFAVPVTVNSFSLPDYRWGGSTAKIRIYANMAWTSSNSTPHIAGNPGNTTGFFQEITCSVVGSTLFIPAFTLDSTIDSIDHNTVRVTAVIFDSLGRAHEQLFSNWRIPNTPTPTTWAALVIYNQGQPKPLADTYATLPQVSAMIAAAVASSATYTARRFDSGDVNNPCSPYDVFGQNGEFYGCGESNNPAQFLRASNAINIASLSGSLINIRGQGFGAKCDGVTDDSIAIALALAAALNAGTGLYVPYGTCVTNSQVFTVMVRFEIGGSLYVNNGQTVTLSKGFDAPSRGQVFKNIGSGLGAVVIQ